MEGSDFLLAGVLFLFAAVAAVPLASRLGIGAVLGYLLAGIAIGPWGLWFISDVDEILHFSELGVVFLMFIIGLMNTGLKKEIISIILKLKIIHIVLKRLRLRLRQIMLCEL